MVTRLVEMADPLAFLFGHDDLDSLAATTTLAFL